MTKFDTMLKAAGEIETYGWSSLYSDILAVHREAPLKYQAKWLDKWKCDNPDMYALPVLGKEHARQCCVDCVIKTNRSVIITVYNYSGFRDDRSDKRCQFTIPMVAISILKPYVIRELEQQAVALEEKEFKARRVARRKVIFNKLCKGEKA